MILRLISLEIAVIDIPHECAAVVNSALMNLDKFSTSISTAKKPDKNESRMKI